MAKPDRRRARQLPVAEPPPRPWTVLALTAAGMGIAGYLTWLKLTGVRAALCAAGTGCDLVQSSRYATLLGVPTAAWAVALYAAVAVLALAGLTAGRWLTAFALAAGGVGFSAYLTYLSVFEIGATCVYCLASAAIVVALLVALLRARPAVVPHRSPLRPARLAWLGTGSAVGAVLAGVLVFAAGTGGGPAGYEVALARHLTATRAVMYGAYW